MNNERLYQILLGPVFSEKAQRLADSQGVQVFRVTPTATKLEIKRAVEKLFGVEVQAVNTVSIKGKAKRFGQTIGRRSDTKKAYVTLKAGQAVPVADTTPDAVQTVTE